MIIKWENEIKNERLVRFLIVSFVFSIRGSDLILMSFVYLNNFSRLYLAYLITTTHYTLALYCFFYRNYRNFIVTRKIRLFSWNSSTLTGMSVTEDQCAGYVPVNSIFINPISSGHDRLSVPRWRKQNIVALESAAARWSDSTIARRNANCYAATTIARGDEPMKGSRLNSRKEQQERL